MLLPLPHCIAHHKPTATSSSIHKPVLPSTACRTTLHTFPARIGLHGPSRVHHRRAQHQIAAAAPPQTVPILTVLQHSIAANPGHFLLSLGGLIACVALAAFLLAAIPSLLVCTQIQSLIFVYTLSITDKQHMILQAHACMYIHKAKCTTRVYALYIQAFRRTAVALESLAATVEAEVPDTAAAVRLSGFELSDCIEEIALLRYSAWDAGFGMAFVRPTNVETPSPVLHVLVNDYLLALVLQTPHMYQVNLCPSYYCTVLISPKAYVHPCARCPPPNKVYEKEHLLQLTW